MRSKEKKKWRKKVSKDKKGKKKIFFSLCEGSTVCGDEFWKKYTLKWWI
jgi:hypothetical protein